MILHDEIEAFPDKGRDERHRSMKDIGIGGRFFPPTLSQVSPDKIAKAIDGYKVIDKGGILSNIESKTK